MKANMEYYSPATQKVRRALLYAIDREYSMLRAKDPTLNADPKTWGTREVLALMTSMRARGLSHATQVQHLSALKKLLEFVGNNTIGAMRVRTPHIFPKVDSERKGALTGQELETVLKTAGELEGWPGECARFVFATYAYTGVRLSELARAQKDDLDTNKWTFRVSHPKGERTYGVRRLVPIPEALRPIVARYLKARETELAKRGLLETHPLVFCTNASKHLTPSTVDTWKETIVRRSGVRFSPHSLRRTYGQILLDRGVDIQSVSVMLGHNSTRTTEAHYCRKNADSARLEVLQALQSRAPSTKNPELTAERYLPGYA
jgi:site-specific recombinase XerD